MRNASEKEDIVNSNHNEDIYNLEDVDTTSNTVDPKALNKQVSYKKVCPNLATTLYLVLDKLI